MSASRDGNGLRREDGSLDPSTVALAVYFVALIAIVAVLLIVSALP